MKREWTIKELEAFDAVASGPEPAGSSRAVAGARRRMPPAISGGEVRAILLEGPARRGRRAQAHAQVQSREIRAAAAGAGAPAGEALHSLHGRDSGPAEIKGPLSGETILLAQTTNDLYDEREQVHAYLQQFGAKVCRRATTCWAVLRLQRQSRPISAKAGLFVQLLGPFRSSRPPDLKDDDAAEPKSYAQFQYDAAKSCRSADPAMAPP